MGRHCCIIGCNAISTQLGLGKSKLPFTREYFCIPTAKQRGDEETIDLARRRRLAWITAIGQPNITFDRVNRGNRVCSRHFIKGAPAYERLVNDPDWAPSLFLWEYRKEVTTTNSKSNTKRKKKKKEAPTYKDKIEDSDTLPCSKSKCTQTKKISTTEISMQTEYAWAMPEIDITSGSCERSTLEESRLCPTPEDNRGMDCSIDSSLPLDNSCGQHSIMFNRSTNTYVPELKTKHAQTIIQGVSLQLLPTNGDRMMLIKKSLNTGEESTYVFDPATGLLSCSAKNISILLPQGTNPLTLSGSRIQSLLTSSIPSCALSHVDKPLAHKRPYKRRHFDKPNSLADASRTSVESSNTLSHSPNRPRLADYLPKTSAKPTPNFDKLNSVAAASRTSVESCNTLSHSPNRPRLADFLPKPSAKPTPNFDTPNSLASASRTSVESSNTLSHSPNRPRLADYLPKPSVKPTCIFTPGCKMPTMRALLSKSPVCHKRTKFSPKNDRSIGTSEEQVLDLSLHKQNKLVDRLSGEKKLDLSFHKQNKLVNRSSEEQMLELSLHKRNKLINRLSQEIGLELVLQTQLLSSYSTAAQLTQQEPSGSNVLLVEKTCLGDKLEEVGLESQISGYSFV